jgi:hypothetical protein
MITPGVHAIGAVIAAISRISTAISGKWLTTPCSGWALQKKANSGMYKSLALPAMTSFDGMPCVSVTGHVRFAVTVMG